MIIVTIKMEHEHKRELLGRISKRMEKERRDYEEVNTIIYIHIYSYAYEDRLASPTKYCLKQERRREGIRRE
jgi:hypothetical protein